ncbi:MAG TPA: hypothetical protein VJ438_01535 [Candidatus Nanoarchaeia archaeon]|nr:hypothetical protein [Candidatus Nanoarchaeia archaeon]
MEKIYQVQIKGTTALLQNRFSNAESITESKKKASTTKENNVENTLYVMPDKKVYQPAECIKQSMIEAGKSFKKGRGNVSKTFASFILVTPEAIIHEKQKWIVDRRAVVIPSTKGRVMRNRARFNEWSLSFEIEVLDDDEINAKLLNDVLSQAGHYVGIGDYRPQKKGIYGRFIITSFKEKK